MLTIEHLLQHFRYGLRGLRREPVFALTTILTLALGAAATTTVFSVVDAELWRPLPYERPNELLAVVSRPEATKSTDGISFTEFQAWRERATGFSNLTPHGDPVRRTAQLGYAESFRTIEVTADYFTTLGRRAIAGRLFSAPDVQGTAVLTERGWRRVFNGNPSAIGRSFLLEDHAVTIIGIVANDDSMGLDGELYIPIDERSPRPGIRFYGMIGRLAPGATAAEATQQVQAAINERALIDPARRGHIAFTQDLSDFYKTSNARPLFFFLGASVLVLLLTIANVAGLIMSRAIRRTPEFAVRSAIGGGSRSLVAQLMAEGALIAVPGCLLGLALTYAATRVLGQFVPEEFLYRGTQIAIDLRVVLTTLIVALATTAGLALVPAGIIRRIGERAALGSGHRTSDALTAARSRRILLIGQLALTVTLLAGAGVFVKSYLALLQVPLGFDPASAWSVRIAMSGERFSQADAVRTQVAEVIDRLQRVPGIEHVSPATSSPLNSGWLAMVTPSAAPNMPPVRAILRTVGADYFSATGTSIHRGRAITNDDRAGAPVVAIVNEELVRRVFGDENPIGRTIDLQTMRAPVPAQRAVTIVGVAADIKETGLNEVSFADVYLPFAQHPQSSVELIVRGHGSDAAMMAALRAAASDPFVPVTAVESLRARVDAALQGERFNLLVVTAFAVLAVLTASIGIYGAMAYAVSARAREFGVRLALGASPRSLLGRTLWQSAQLAVIAGGIGLAGALMIARWIGDGLYLVPGKHNGLLYDTKVDDPPALITAVIAVVAVSVLAGIVPARRASRVNPVQALRAD